MSGHRGPTVSSMGKIPGVWMVLSLGDNHPNFTCECGRTGYGDSVSDAILAWGRHVTNECKLNGNL